MNTYIKRPNLGDCCVYCKGKDGRFYVIVKVVGFLKDGSGAKVNLLKIIRDDTEDGYFTSLLESGEVFDANFEYLYKIND